MEIPCWCGRPSRSLLVKPYQKSGNESRRRRAVFSVSFCMQHQLLEHFFGASIGDVLAVKVAVVAIARAVGETRPGNSNVFSNDDATSSRGGSERYSRPHFGDFNGFRSLEGTHFYRSMFRLHSLVPLPLSNLQSLQVELRIQSPQRPSATG